MENNTQYTITLDDDPLICRTIEKMMGIKSLPFTSVDTFLTRAPRYNPLGIFIDIFLGENQNGLDVIPKARQLWPFCPIFVITSDDINENLGNALVNGANDFIQKPFNALELAARFRIRTIEMNVLASSEVVSFGDIKLDRRRNLLAGKNHVHYLSGSDFKLMTYLVQSNGLLVPRDELKRVIWDSIHVSDGALDKKIFDIRQALKSVSQNVSLKAKYGGGVILASKFKFEILADV